MYVAAVIVHLCDNCLVAMANVVNVALTVAVNVLRASDGNVDQGPVLGTMELDYRNVDLRHLSVKIEEEKSTISNRQPCPTKGIVTSSSFFMTTVITTLSDINSLLVLSMSELFCSSSMFNDSNENSLSFCLLTNLQQFNDSKKLFIRDDRNFIFIWFASASKYTLNVDGMKTVAK